VSRKSIPPKIVHLTSAHPALDIRIYYKEIRSLAAAGYRIILVAPSHPSEPDRAPGVEIKRFPRPRGRLRRFLLSAIRIYPLALAERGDLYHFHDPELIPLGLLLKLLGRRVVYDVHEYYALSMRARTWLPKGLRTLTAGFSGWLESACSRAFDGIVAVTPVIAGKFPRGKTILVQNFALDGEFDAALPIPYEKRPPIVFFMGVLTAVRGVREMVDAVGLLPESLGARLRIAGKIAGEPLADQIVRRPGWRRVEFMGQKTPAELAGLIGEARLGLLLYHPVPGHLLAQPHKLFEYMSASLPIVASDIPLWRRMITSAGCGLLVNPLDPKAVAEAIQWLLDHPREAEAMGRRGREAMRRDYNWDHEAAKLIAFYRRLLPEPIALKPPD